ncbi:cob(I)yrinic acid a,c-diamide adenosyltransferase [Bacteroides sp.]|uniref:cob(I)yrinic acid a,c-diamide adenosyltransferase n=1 Tax=Bacteroides sp. TaxID=29523 RepID=UPI00258B5DC4|nr:cob(I)yrinic acid a,c-diamide adenosyltransferase [Bacteroides sp.]
MAVRIYTKGGDKGMTSIHGGTRVDKDDIRIEANGALDELNSVIGVVRSFMAEEDSRHEILYRIQKEMMVVMSLVATPSEHREKNPNTFDESIIPYCEELIDEMVAQIPENEFFILPGGNPISAHLQWARTIARRSERRLWTLHRSDALPDELLKFINRLSDLFFIMGREEMSRDGKAEEKWHKFLYKRKKK